jgi:hypothetical protein
MGPCSGLAPWRLAVQSLMGELVDGRAPGASWMVAHSESEIGKKRPVLGPDRPEDHPEAPGWWGQVELGTVGPVPSSPCSCTRRKYSTGTPPRS